MSSSGNEHQQKDPRTSFSDAVSVDKDFAGSTNKTGSLNTCSATNSSSRESNPVTKRGQGDKQDESPPKDSDSDSNNALNVTKRCEDSTEESPCDDLQLPPVVDNLDIPNDPFGDEYTDRRLWIGNLDTRMTEFAVLKIVQKFGTIRKMDFVYHKSGPDRGKSKGYCFVSFHTWEAAENARKALDGKFAMGRSMYVKWAQGAREFMEDSFPQVTKAAAPTVPAPGPHRSGLVAASDSLSADAKIKAIEAKLRTMDQTSKDFSIGERIKAPPGYTPLTNTSRHSERGSSRGAPYRRSQSSGIRHRRR